jgi:hypothetical protein
MPAEVQIDGSIIEINGNTYNAKTINSIHIEPHPNPKALAINKSVLWARLWLCVCALILIGNTLFQLYFFKDAFLERGKQGQYLKTIMFMGDFWWELLFIVHIPTAIMALSVYMIPLLLRRAANKVMEMHKVEPYAAIHFTLSNREKVMVYVALKGECNEIYKKLKQTINH